MPTALRDRGRSPNPAHPDAGDLARLLRVHGAESDSARTTVHFSGEAAEQLRALEESTGQSAESVLEMSLGLLETLVAANGEGRHLMLVSRHGFPLRRVVLPCQA